MLETNTYRYPATKFDLKRNSYWQATIQTLCIVPYSLLCDSFCICTLFVFVQIFAFVNVFVLTCCYSNIVFIVPSSLVCSIIWTLWYSGVAMLTSGCFQTNISRICICIYICNYLYICCIWICICTCICICICTCICACICTCICICVTVMVSFPNKNFLKLYLYLYFLCTEQWWPQAVSKQTFPKFQPTFYTSRRQMGGVEKANDSLKSLWSKTLLFKFVPVTYCLYQNFSCKLTALSEHWVVSSQLDRYSWLFFGI